jgi:hypothetical protein
MLASAFLTGGRPPAFDRERHEDRNTVERCFSKLKQFHAVATRYDKHGLMYQGTVDVALIRIWLRGPALWSTGRLSVSIVGGRTLTKSSPPPPWLRTWQGSAPE